MVMASALMNTVANSTLTKKVPESATGNKIIIEEILYCTQKIEFLVTRIGFIQVKRSAILSLNQSLVILLKRYFIQRNLNLWPLEL